MIEVLRLKLCLDVNRKSILVLLYIYDLKPLCCPILSRKNDVFHELANVMR